MSLPVRRNLTVTAGGGADDSKSGPFQSLSLELLFKIAEYGLTLADFRAFASTNKDLFSKLIGRLLEKGMNTNRLPLQWACTKHGSGPATLEAIVQFHPQGRQLLSAYFEHDDANVLGQTPLIVAIRAANFRVVRLLLKYGADVNQPEKNPSTKNISSGTWALWSPVHFAVGYDLVPKGPERLGSGNAPRLREKIVRILLQNRAVDVEKSTKSIDPCAVMSPLFLHISNGPSHVSAAIIQQLLEHGAKGTRSSLYKVQWIPEVTSMVSPLSLLIAECKSRRNKDIPDEVMLVVPLLISAGDGAGGHTTSGGPLIMDCLNPCEHRRWIHIADMLLSSGRQSARAVNIQGEPAVVWLMIRLLDYELWFEFNHLYATRMERQNQYDMVRACTYQMLQLLMHYGADINARCPADHSEYPGATALMIAAGAREEFRDVFLDLLESGADAKARDSKGRTVLFGLFAGRLSNPNDRVQALHEAGTPMNATDKNGDTVLHYAAKHSRRPFSNWLPKLLAHGCDLSKKNNQNMTFVDVLCNDVPPKQRKDTRKSILEDIQRAKEDAVKVKKQERIEKYRMKLEETAEKDRERRGAAKAAQEASHAGPSTAQSGASTAQTGPSTSHAGTGASHAGPNTAQAGASTAKVGFGTAQTGPSTAQLRSSTAQLRSSTAQAGVGSVQVSGPDNSSQPVAHTTQAGPKILRISTKGAQRGSGAAQAGSSTAPVVTPNQRRPDRSLCNNTAQTTHESVQASPRTPRSYATAAQTSLGAARAGSRTVAPAGPRAIASAGPRPVAPAGSRSVATTGSRPVAPAGPRAITQASSGATRFGFPTDGRSSGFW